MTEHLKSTGEHIPQTPERQSENTDKLEPLGQTAETESHPDNLPRLQEKARTEAQRSADIVVDTASESASDHMYGAHNKLKADAYARTLQRIQSRLRPADRMFSKIVHQKPIDTLSTLGAQTLARSSGVLGGGMLALLGSSVLLYMSKHYGFTYNLFVFFVLFAGGFVAGTVIELIIRATRKPS